MRTKSNRRSHGCARDHSVCSAKFQDDKKVKGLLADRYGAWIVLEAHFAEEYGHSKSESGDDCR